MKSIAFFNNKGGLDQTSLVYHLGWKFADLGYRVLMVDLDPQSNLTRMSIHFEFDIDEQWGELQSRSLYHSVKTLMEKGTDDIKIFEPEVIDDERLLYLLPGDLDLSRLEDELSVQWTKSLDGNERALRVVTAFYRVIQETANQNNIEIVLIDIGPNLGAINRCALIASDFVITPLTPDLYSLQGLESTGPALIRWRKDWDLKKSQSPSDLNFKLPEARMEPLGYVITRRSLRIDRPIKAYENWINQMPRLYWERLLARPPTEDMAEMEPFRLATLKDNSFLTEMAQEAHVPMFNLRSGHGAYGSFVYLVQRVDADFKALAETIRDRIHLPPPRDD
ncbi:MAG: AAA family ATPase [Candidatus Pacebacteria bacterium]|nr:AAA family ATPase [Candidatus Paceibacterota bacterium]